MMPAWAPLRGLAVLAAAAALGAPASAATPKTVAAPGNDAPAEQHLFGDWGGVRTDLQDSGVTLSADYTGQVASNVEGGGRRGADYAQQIQLSADIDWAKLVGAPGVSTHAILVNRAGRNASSDYVGDNLFQSQSVYGGAGDVGLHLVQVYAEAALLDGRVDIAGGRLPVGEDFATSPLYCDFLNTAVCGYPHSLPAKVGFTAFPNSTWGARLRVAPMDHLYVQAGAYEVRPQYGGRSGFDWGWSGTTGGYFPVEVGYEPLLGAEAMPGHYKLGAAWDSSRYPDQLRDGAGAPYPLSLAPPATHDGRGSLYLLADQMILRRSNRLDDGLILLGGYVRSSRNTSQFSRFAFVGALAPSPLPSRNHDNIGIVVAWAKVSDRLGDAQRLQAQLGLPLEDEATGVQSDETIVEGRYNVALGHGIGITPDIQFITQPGAARTVRNATVLAVQIKVEL